MKTNVRIPVILVCLLSFVLIAALILLREPASESESPADSPPAAQELARAAEPKLEPDPTSQRPRMQTPPQSQSPTPVPEQTPTPPTEPPEDPDEVRQWTREYPERALVWMMTAPAGPQRDTVAEIACAKIAEIDPAQAVALAERYAGGCTNLVENLVHQWSERNEPAARAYALAQPAGEERDRLLGRVALVQSKADPRSAAQLVVEQMSPGPIQNEAVMSVLHQWAARDPGEALEWARLFPEGALRDRALAEIGSVSRHFGGESTL